MSRPMSAIGPKRTFAFAPHMSAFGGKADIPRYAIYSLYDPDKIFPQGFF